MDKNKNVFYLLLESSNSTRFERRFLELEAAPVEGGTRSVAVCRGNWMKKVVIKFYLLLL